MGRWGKTGYRGKMKTILKQMIQLSKLLQHYQKMAIITASRYETELEERQGSKNPIQTKTERKKQI